LEKAIEAATLWAKPYYNAEEIAAFGKGDVGKVPECVKKCYDKDCWSECINEGAHKGCWSDRCQVHEDAECINEVIVTDDHITGECVNNELELKVNCGDECLESLENEGENCIITCQPGETDECDINGAKVTVTGQAFKVVKELKVKLDWQIKRSLGYTGFSENQLTLLLKFKCQR